MSGKTTASTKAKTHAAGLCATPCHGPVLAMLSMGKVYGCRKILSISEECGLLRVVQRFISKGRDRLGRWGGRRRRWRDPWRSHRHFLHSRREMKMGA